MPGVLSCGAYVPYRRLDRSAPASVVGGTPAKGERAVASFDEDTTTMAVEAARLCGRDGIGSLWLSTTEPTYVDKTNATAVHAALRLDASVGAYDANGSVRSVVGALRAGLSSSAPAPALVIGSDIRGGLPGSADESSGGDAAAAVVVGDGPGVVAELIGSASVTEEFTDRWRVPGERRSRLWEERFGEQSYGPLGDQAWREALKSAGVESVDVALVAGTHGRAVARLSKSVGANDALTPAVGNTGAAHPLLLLTDAIERSSVGQTIALAVLSDGADVFVFRVSGDHTPVRSVAAQVESKGAVPYGKFLSWRGALTVEPPNRPEPARTSSSAAARNADWKFGLVGDSGTPLSEQQGTVARFTVDRLVWSPSPPVVFAVVDFDDGTRLPCELTDVDPDAVKVGDRVEMTFRRLATSDGIANYFWKARPVR